MAGDGPSLNLSEHLREFSRAEPYDYDKAFKEVMDAQRQSHKEFAFWTIEYARQCMHDARVWGEQNKTVLASITTMCRDAAATFMGLLNETELERFPADVCQFPEPLPRVMMTEDWCLVAIVAVLVIGCLCGVATEILIHRCAKCCPRFAASLAKSELTAEHSEAVRQLARREQEVVRWRGVVADISARLEKQAQ
jgi:hypothetical protein